MNLIKERDVALFCGGFCAALIAGILLLTLALGMVSCAASRPTAPTQRPALAAPNPALVPLLDSAALNNRLPQHYASLPAYLVPAPAGSTPRQRRQWQRAQVRNLALSGILPTKIKNSSVATAPGATAINQPRAPVATQGSSATDARKAGQRHGTAAVGPGAVATSTQPVGVAWWVYVLVALIGTVSWEVGTHYLLPLKWLPWRTSRH